jgi:hypothetical protein
VLASVAGQKSRRPKFAGIAEVLGLPARQRHQPCLGVQRNRQFSAGARAIVERRHRAFGHGAFDAAPDRLMMQPEHPSYRKRKGLPDRPEYPHPLDPDCRLGSRLRDRFYFADAHGLFVDGKMHGLNEINWLSLKSDRLLGRMPRKTPG